MATALNQPLKYLEQSMPGYTLMHITHRQNHSESGDAHTFYNALLKNCKHIQSHYLNMSQPYRPPRPVMPVALLYFYFSPSPPNSIKVLKFTPKKAFICN
jgi:hypothetical protein